MITTTKAEISGTLPSSMTSTEQLKIGMTNKFFRNKEIKPFTSLLIILCALFVTAFFKITLRRFSYSLYRENRKFDQIQDKYYSNLRIYGKLTQPDRLESLAEKHSLDKKKKGQVIQVIDGKALVID